ncbi:MAG: hypothetical protein GMKNLPBB_02305 [Myxococcota bacterium]|nr:hypothetical protein [Myxococcota bacterium]
MKFPARRWIPAAAGLYALTCILLFRQGTCVVPDEAYYQLWSLRLDWGYLDHPPLIAWLLRVFPIWSPEFHPLMISALAAYLLCLRAESAAASPRAWIAIAAAPALLAAFAFATPDLPLLIFSTLALIAMRAAAAHNRPRDWIFLGLWSGLGLLSKLSMLLLLAINLPALLWAAKQRRAEKGLLLAVLVFLLITAPWWWWSFTHEFLPFSFQFAHRSREGWSAFSLGRPVILLLVSACLLGPLMAALLIRHYRSTAPLIDDWISRWREGGSRLPAGEELRGSAPERLWLWWNLLAPAAVLIIASVFVYAEVNWGLIAFPAAVLLVLDGEFPSGKGFRAAAWGLGMSLALMIPPMVIAAAHVAGERPGTQPADQLFHQSDRLYASLREFQRAHPGAPRALAGFRYQGAALLNHAALRAHPGFLDPCFPVAYIPDNRRRSQFDLWRKDCPPAHREYLTPRNRPAEWPSGWQSAWPLESVELLAADDSAGGGAAGEGAPAWFFRVRLRVEGQ